MAGKTFLNKKFKNDHYMKLAPWVVVLNVLFYLTFIVCRSPKFANTLALENFLNWTVFQPYMVLKGSYFWTMLTYPFVSTEFLQLLFDSFFILIFGTRYELEIGSKEFLFLHFSSSFFAAAACLGLSAFTDINYVLFGANASVFALMFVYSMLHRYESVLLFFVIRMKLPMAVLALLIVDCVFLYLGWGSLSSVVLGFLGFIYALFYASARIRVGVKQFFMNLF